MAINALRSSDLGSNDVEWSAMSWHRFCLDESLGVASRASWKILEDVKGVASRASWKIFADVKA